MDIYLRTHVGNIRTHNEDTVYVSGKTTPILAMVADGMGGQAGGKTASENAVAYISGELGDKLRKADAKALKSAAHNASERIYNIAKRDEAFKNMGTTLAAAIIDDEVVHAVNVGDSRIYHLSKNGMKRITKDHKYVQYLVDKGMMTPEEAKNHPYRNIITRALGMEDIEADSYEFSWSIGDTVLICSDGLYEELSEEKIEDILNKSTSAKNKTDALIDSALESGGRDNISAVVIINDGIIGTLIKNRFEIIRPIAEGGMSRIYLAQDKKEKKNVAVKILKSEFNDNKQIVEGFLHEAEITSRLVHKNIVRTIAYGTKNSYRYIVMDYIEGCTLADRLKNNKLSIEECISIMQKLLSAMSYAHHRGVIHKDLKPHNILMDIFGEPYITDFGIAEDRESEHTTKEYKAVGSVNYFSPEQAMGAKVGPAADIYSLGIMLYEMVTGKLPFIGEDELAVALMHLHTPPTPPSELDPQIPESINKIILKAIAKEPENRYRSAAAMGRDIARCLTDRSGQYIRMAGEGEEERSVSTGRMTAIFAITISIIGVITWGLITFITQIQEDRAVYMPYLVDQVQDSALSSLNDINIDIDISIMYEKGIGVADGVVINQSPEPGTALKDGDSVTVVVCKYTEELPNMPYIKGMTQQEAREYLISEGFNMSNVVYAQTTDDILKNGVVAAQYPEAGTAMTEESRIVIYVNRVFVYNQGYVPDVDGLAVDDALLGISEYNYENIFVYARYKENSDYGVVYRQQPMAGDELVDTTAMSIYINDIGEPEYKGRFTVPWAVVSAVDREKKSSLIVTADTEYEGVYAKLVVFSGEMAYSDIRNMNVMYTYFDMFSSSLNNSIDTVLRFYVDGEELATREITLERVTGNS